MVAFVDDDEAVPGGDVFRMSPTGQGRQQCDVEDTCGFRASAANLAARESQVFLDAVAPLVGEGLAVDENLCTYRTGSIAALAITVLPEHG